MSCTTRFLHELCINDDISGSTIAVVGSGSPAFDANARLIAAAPELLAAANAAADVLGNIVCDNESDHGEEAAYNALCDTSAKAKGR